RFSRSRSFRTWRLWRPMLPGLASVPRRQANNAPDIDFPAAIVEVSQPGAAPNELETQVTQRVESAIRGVNGVEEINSTVGEGYSSTFVNFQEGTPTDRAVNDVRNAISQIRGTLPEGRLEPQSTRSDAEGDPIPSAGPEQSVRVLGNAQDAYQLSQTQITLPGGRFVKLADLAEVRDSNSEQRSIAKQSGRQVVTFSVQRAKGSSEVTDYDAMWKELK